MTNRIQQRGPEDVLGPLTELERKHAPQTLYLVGDEGLLERGPRVSVVGSRRLSEEGRRRAAFLTRELVSRDIIVVSGLAEGIDTVAHRTAIAEGGHTIAVVGTPLDRVFPKANAALFEEIARNHLAVSQFPIGSVTTRKSFPMRNRTMALLTDATVIVEAAARSGTKHQGWEALRLGRLLFIMESVAKDPEVAWARRMIEYGAQVLRRENLGDVLDNLPAFTATGEAVAF